MHKHSVDAAWQDALSQALVAENKFGSVNAMPCLPAIQFNHVHEIKSSGRYLKERIETAAENSVQVAPIRVPARDRLLREQLAERSISAPELTWEQRLSLSRGKDSSASKTSTLPAAKSHKGTVRHDVEYSGDLDLQLQRAVATLEEASGGRATTYEFARNDHRMTQPKALNTPAEIEKDRWVMQGIIAFATTAIGGSILLFITLFTLHNLKTDSDPNTRDGREWLCSAIKLRHSECVIRHSGGWHEQPGISGTCIAIG